MTFDEAPYRRGVPTEQHDLASERPDMVDELRGRFDEVIARGASRPGIESLNDADVRYDITQTERWAPPAGQTP